VGCRTRPPVLFRPSHQSRLHRISFDVSNGIEAMSSIEGHGFESSLPRMSDQVVFLIEVCGVITMGGLNHKRKRFFIFGNEDMVDVVGHKAIRPNRDMVGLAGIMHHPDINLVIRVIPKYIGFAISSLGHVMCAARHNNSRGSHKQVLWRKCEPRRAFTGYDSDVANTMEKRPD